MLAFISVILGIICTEAITELVVHSQIFSKIRDIAESFGEYGKMLFNCGYCFSIWSAALCAYTIAPLTIPHANRYVNLLVWTIVFHRLSNFLNDFVDKYLANPIETLTETDFSNADEHFGISRGSHDATDIDLSNSQ